MAFNPLSAFARQLTPLRSRCPSCSGALLRASTSSSSSAVLLRPHWSVSTYATSNAPKRPLQKSTQIKDEDIPLRQIILVDPETNALLPPAPLRTILSQLDRTRYSILLVATDKGICKILDKKKEYDKKKDKAQAIKDKNEQARNNASPSSSGGGGASVATGSPPKEIQMTWGVSTHDLEHKLKKGRQFLEKGHRVTVIIKNKAGAPHVPKEAQDTVIRNVEERFAEVGKLSRDPIYRGTWVYLEFTRK
ncbi:BZ3500_MvSof-1268-A1-R1_Chr6-3g08636 [Microbotryum saponariae]|uniref:BZ3500_MvSof-1268-A1-R1_Chr6-3g08636 protein n=1 Tax=Microbotryum saponariae TaxID=289078 RepID=A0A2X0K9Y7_9BASI|nr:BZ3501_MvSof-1269-A2-R1_C40g00183 [Microbotryum saponariae]SCZ93404.1 BZ3500_MvSof-1268-A1-R1_Chr6-3g08636 [Microbotryum saponariae]SDA07237.1 BZ3501_MvSof-1269-A2-R1_Chr6-2g08339 [Microbotryum saponariae]